MQHKLIIRACDWSMTNALLTPRQKRRGLWLDCIGDKVFLMQGSVRRGEFSTDTPVTDIREAAARWIAPSEGQNDVNNPEKEELV